ncbi:Protein of unknown function [Cotesia congregata]|uniref:Uncharacterized protein n=1 Tax=Cotesia congregata TaxID=51543 RepID=A0A8J2HE30_COTCN|nr:Protein of unknown function [Cotesia congregata]
MNQAGNDYLKNELLQELIGSINFNDIDGQKPRWSKFRVTRRSYVSNYYFSGLYVIRLNKVVLCHTSWCLWYTKNTRPVANLSHLSKAFER